MSPDHGSPRTAGSTRSRDAIAQASAVLGASGAQAVIAGALALLVSAILLGIAAAA
jgi:hypothetical protein